jgi:hypothetical protein
VTIFGDFKKRSREVWKFGSLEVGKSHCDCRLTDSKHLGISLSKQILSSQDLSQHIRMLLLNARTLKEASNQTDVIFETSQRESIGSQTVDDMSKEKLREALQAPDRNFAKLITEAENERMKAESDLKFAVVELEQRLKGEHDREVFASSRSCYSDELKLQMRRIKEQKQTQFDEIVRFHKEEMIQLQQNFDHDISQERDKVVQLQVRTDSLIGRNSGTRHGRGGGGMGVYTPPRTAKHPAQTGWGGYGNFLHV